MAAWRRIVDKLFDEDSYGGLIRKAAQLSKTDPFFASVYNRLSKIKTLTYRHRYSKLLLDLDIISLL